MQERYRAELGQSCCSRLLPRPVSLLQQGTSTLDITCHYVFVSKNTENPKQQGNVSGFKGEQTTSTLFAKGVCFLVIVRKTTNKNMLSRVTVYYLMFSSYKEYHLSNDFLYYTVYSYATRRYNKTLRSFLTFVLKTCRNRILFQYSCTDRHTYQTNYMYTDCRPKYIPIN